MGDVLQCLLDAEAAWVCKPPGRVRLIVGPGGKAALAEAAHAIRLVGADHLLFFRRDENQRVVGRLQGIDKAHRSEEHTSELQSLMRISYAVFCLKKKKNK